MRLLGKDVYLQRFEWVLRAGQFGFSVGLLRESGTGAGALETQVSKPDCDFTASAEKSQFVDYLMVKMVFDPFERLGRQDSVEDAVVGQHGHGALALAVAA